MAGGRSRTRARGRRRWRRWTFAARRAASRRSRVPPSPRGRMGIISRVLRFLPCSLSIDDYTFGLAARRTTWLTPSALARALSLPVLTPTFAPPACVRAYGVCAYLGMYARTPRGTARRRAKMASEIDAARAALFLRQARRKDRPMAMAMAIAMPPAAAAVVDDDDGGDAAARRRGFRRSSEPGRSLSIPLARRLVLDFLMEEIESCSRRGLGRVARRRQRQATEPRAQVAPARIRRNRKPLSLRRQRDRVSRGTRRIAEGHPFHRASTYLLSWTRG